jgi:hypothetical protein
MKLGRDAWLMILLLVILVTIMVVAGTTQTEPVPPLTSASSAPNGAKALKLWLPKLGFTVNESLVAEFAPPEGVDTVLMLQPFGILVSEWDALDAWVETGGMLIIAGNTSAMSPAASHYDFSLAYLFEIIPPLDPASPLHSSPALTAPVEVENDAVLTSERDDYIVHLAAKEGALVVSFEQGKGRVVLSTNTHIFTNLGLKNDANAAFVLNLLALAEPKSTVWFDEWHHGYRAAAAGEAIIGPGQWLRHTLIGNAFIFILAVVFLGLLLQGVAFGRPVPLPREIRRRGVIEHVTAVANLGRRASHRSDVLRQYHAQVKRRLGKRYRLDPFLPDAEYVASLKPFNPSLDSEKLLRLLRGLSQKDVSEADMVKLAAEAAEWIKE